MVLYHKEKSWIDKFEPLIPQEKMEPYDPCWCRSGKKWKFCHKIRQSESALSRAILARNSFNYAKQYKICMHPDAPKNCEGKIAKAHTLQKSRSLMAIAERGHVLSIKDALGQPDFTRTIVPKSKGVDDASIFRGFCQKHDSEMFREIDIGQLTADIDSAYKLAFRSICYEMYQKNVGLKTAYFLRENIDKGMSWSGQVNAQQEIATMIHGFEGAIADFAIQKRKFDRYYHAPSELQFNFYSEIFEEVFPLAISTAFSPEYGFSGVLLQTLSVPIGRLELLSLNLISVGGKTLVSFSWMGEPNGANHSFVREYLNLPPSRKFDALVILAFEFTEHIFLKPSWWTSLSTYEKNNLSARWSNTPGSHQSDCLKLGEKTFGFCGPGQVTTNVLDFK